MLLMLAKIYETDVLRLLDLADHESLDPKERLALVRPPRPRATGPLGGKLSRWPASAPRRTLPACPCRCHTFPAG